MSVKLYLKNKKGNYIDIPLYGDESIKHQSKVSDTIDLDTVFNDTTETFTIPASDILNEFLENWHEIGTINDFNITKRIDALIEINSIPYKEGSARIFNPTTMKGRVVDYKVEFAGKLVSISNKFSDDKLSDVKTLSKYDINYGVDYLLDLIRRPDSIGTGDIMMPLFFLTNKNYELGNETFDLREVRPALRIKSIIEAIEEYYDITLKSSLFDRKQFKRLFLWLNNIDTIEELDDLVEWKELEFPDKEEYGNDNVAFDVDNNIITFLREINDYRDFLDSDPYQPNETVTYTEWGIRTEADINLPPGYEIKLRLINADTNSIIEESDWTVGGGFSSETGTLSLPLTIGSDYNETFTNKVRLEYKLKGGVDIEPLVYIWGEIYIRSWVTDGNNQYEEFFNLHSGNNNGDWELTSRIPIIDNVPDITVSSFFKGILQAFRMVIIPIGDDEYLLEPISEFYDKGKVVNLSEYLDVYNYDTQVNQLNNIVEFKWNESDLVLQKEFRERTGRGYCDNIIKLDGGNGHRKIELPFTSVITTRLPFQNGQGFLTVAFHQTVKDDGDLEPSNDGVFIFYYNGIEDLSIFDNTMKIDIGNETIIDLPRVGISTIIDGDNIGTVNNILSFGLEMESYLNQAIEKNLFTNYWDSWFSTIYDKNSRTNIYEGILPLSILRELELNDKIIVGNNIYNINEYNINLLTMEFKISLFPYYRKYHNYIPSTTNIVYNLNMGDNYHTLDLADYSKWEYNIIYHGQSSDWITTDYNTSIFNDRFFNFRTSYNDGNNRKATIYLTNVDNNEQLVYNITQNGEN